MSEAIIADELHKSKSHDEGSPPRLVAQRRKSLVLITFITHHRDRYT